jgi:hypothetical protein
MKTKNALAIVEVEEITAAPTSFIVNVSEGDKTFLMDLQEELGLRSSKELITVLLAVSTGLRFNDEGDDRFEIEATSIIAGRSKAKAMALLEKTKAKLRELEAMIG